VTGPDYARLEPLDVGRSICSETKRRDASTATQRRTIRFVGLGWEEGTVVARVVIERVVVVVMMEEEESLVC
jgi:hypothetical protein